MRRLAQGRLDTQLGGARDRTRNLPVTPVNPLHLLSYCRPSLPSVSLVVEWIPTRVRTVVGTGTGYFYTMGQLILALVAYFIRDWRWLTFAVSLPFYVAFLYSW